MLELRYQDGTILVFIRDDESVMQNTNQSAKKIEKTEKTEKIKELFLGHFRSQFRFDQRVNGWRAEAYVYPQIVYFAIQNKIPYIDAKNWEKENDIIHRSIRTPRDSTSTLMRGRVLDSSTRNFLCFSMVSQVRPKVSGECNSVLNC